MTQKKGRLQIVWLLFFFFLLTPSHRGTFLLSLSLFLTLVFFGLFLHVSLPQEIKLATHVVRFAETINIFVGDLLPHRLCDYLYELCGVYTEYYDKCYCVERDAASDVRSRGKGAEERRETWMSVQKRKGEKNQKNRARGRDKNALAHAC